MGCRMDVTGPVNQDDLSCAEQIYKIPGNDHGTRWKPGAAEKPHCDHDNYDAHSGFKLRVFPMRFQEG